MKCSIATERLVECARRRVGPDPATRTHLLGCSVCMDRWEAEKALTAQMRRLSALASGLRSSDTSKQDVLRQFDALPLRVLPRRAAQWSWALAAAAALLLATALFWNMWQSRRQAAELASVQAAIAQSEGDMESGYGSSEDGFMAVPFAPPLAEGEMVRMVHRELQPVELASLGVDVDPAWLAAMNSNASGGMQAGFPADVLVGADGFPRAVRLSEEPRSEGF